MLLLHTCHSFTSSSSSSSSEPALSGFPGLDTGNQSANKATKALKEWVITSFDSASQWISTQY